MTHFSKFLFAVLVALIAFLAVSSLRPHEHAASVYKPDQIGVAILTPAAAKGVPPLSTRWETFDMGKAHGRRIICALRFQTQSVERDITVNFGVETANGRHIHFSEPTMLGFIDTDHLRIGDFARLGRKQLFISTAYGAAVNYIYDCDGTRVRAIYTLADARQSASMVRRHGRWFVVEQWRGDQYDDDNMGTGVWVDPPGKNAFGLVERRLYWNGRAFVSEYPGPTRIVSAKTFKRLRGMR